MKLRFGFFSLKIFRYFNKNVKKFEFSFFLSVEFSNSANIHTCIKNGLPIHLVVGGPHFQNTLYLQILKKTLTEILNSRTIKQNAARIPIYGHFNTRWILITPLDLIRRFAYRTAHNFASFHALASLVTPSIEFLAHLVRLIVIYAAIKGGIFDHGQGVHHGVKIAHKPGIIQIGVVAHLIHRNIVDAVLSEVHRRHLVHHRTGFQAVVSHRVLKSHRVVHGSSSAIFGAVLRPVADRGGFRYG